MRLSRKMRATKQEKGHQRIAKRASTTGQSKRDCQARQMAVRTPCSGVLEGEGSLADQAGHAGEIVEYVSQEEQGGDAG